MFSLTQTKNIPIITREGFDFGSVLEFLPETNLCYAKSVQKKYFNYS